MKDSEDNVNQELGKECDYGERCYRKNPAHFQEYEHKHLNDLLESLEKTKVQEFPTHFTPKISKQTILEQLEILIKFKSSSVSLTHLRKIYCSLKRPHENNEVHCSSPGTSGNSLRNHSNLDSENDDLQMKNQSDKGAVNQGNSQSKKSNMNNSTVKSLPNKKKHQKDISDTSRPLSSAEHCKKMQRANNLGEAMAYFKEVKKRSQGSILLKHQNAGPYYFFLTSVTDSHHTHSEPLSLQMFDILDSSLGDLKSSLQINFMVEFGWLMAQYHISNQGGKPITLLYGEMDAKETSNIKHITTVNVKCPSPFGSHHTKMCVLAYRDGSLRVCVHTANLVESDWNNRVQGVWLSPVCPALSLDADSDAGESSTNFKRDLIQYLSAYRLPELQPWIGKLRRTDFSHINVFFVASVPGSHKGIDADKWGHTKLSGLLQRHVNIPSKSGCPPSTWQIITQCSSIGSLGPQPTSWFCGEIKKTMSSGQGQGLQSLPPIRLVYPSFDNVAASYDGLLGGGCLPYRKQTHEKQTWLQQYLYQWKCDTRHRTQAMPHIKTYCRVSPDLTQLAWFHLTSANLSKAAWGTQTKGGNTSMLSYEAGVLFVPKFVVKQTTFPIKPEASNGVPVFPMPYDLPLTQFSSKDVPWFSDMLC